ncbi:MAG: hypothetical protein BVN33_09740 [Proteobacteria bacterium ST_bin13]|nr:MAG: hypothetical protein BVN33_09740 [Proteobacteria bacterium ST_bin13]
MKVSPDFNARADAKPRDVAVQSKHERVTQFAEKQFERCKGQWTANYFDRLLKREGNAPALQPSWATNDRKGHLLRAAGHLAKQRLSKNLQRIDRAADRMAGRKSNDLGRG